MASRQYPQVSADTIPSKGLCWKSRQFFIYTAQCSSSLGRRWQNCSIRFSRLSSGYVLAYAIRIKAHIRLYVCFSLFGQGTLSITKFPKIYQCLSIFSTFQTNLRRLFMLWTLFDSKYTRKLPKNKYFNLFGWPRWFCHLLRPLCTLSIKFWNTKSVQICFFCFKCMLVNKKRVDLQAVSSECCMQTNIKTIAIIEAFWSGKIWKGQTFCRLIKFEYFYNVHIY